MPSTNIAQKVARHPQTLPIAVPTGTPTMPETVRPARMSATAMPRCSWPDEAYRDHHCDAEIDAMCEGDGDAQTSIETKSGASAHAACPSVKATASQTSSVLREQPRCHDGEQRAADRDAGRVAGDQKAGAGNRDAKALGHAGQHAGDHELGRAEGEGGKEKGKERERHWNSAAGAEAARNHERPATATEKLWPRL